MLHDESRFSLCCPSVEDEVYGVAFPSMEKTMLFTRGGYINASSYQDKILRPVTTHDPTEKGLCGSGNDKVACLQF